MCTVLLPPGVNSNAVKYISYHVVCLGSLEIHKSMNTVSYEFDKTVRRNADALERKIFLGSEIPDTVM
jgi:hypothetical protein